MHIAFRHATTAHVCASQDVLNPCRGWRQVQDHLSGWRATGNYRQHCHVSHSSPLAAVRHQALAQHAAGYSAAARQMLSDAIESARLAYGEDHPDVLGTAHLLARLHREADDPTAARRVLEEAFAAGERRRGHADPLMLALSFDLASVAEELGNRHEARRNYTRIAIAGSAVLGEDHPAVRTSRQYLGEAVPTPPSSSAPEAAPPPPPPPDSTAPVSAAPAPLWGLTASAPHPQHGAYQPAPAPFHQRPAYPMVSEPAPGRTRTAIAVAATALMIAIVAVVGAALVVLNRDRPTPLSAPKVDPTATGAPPGDLRLRDDATTITITWTDPSGGAVPFVVAGGRAGQTLGAMATVDPGQTTYTVNGLNARVDYCFTVLAVYSTDEYATSGQVCTSREPTASPR